MLHQVIVSLEEAEGLAAEREGVGRVLYDFVAQSSLELSLHKVQYLYVRLTYGDKNSGKTSFFFYYLLEENEILQYL